MKNKSILLVEDNPDDIELTRRAFARHNITNPLVVAMDGAEALDWMFATGAHAGRDAGDLPAVVLLDLKLPKIDGLEVLKQIRANPLTRLQPVVILTSSREQQDLIGGYSLGSNSYIVKPVNFEQFSEVARQLGLYWTLINEHPMRCEPAKP